MQKMLLGTSGEELRAKIAKSIKVHEIIREIESKAVNHQTKLSRSKLKAAKVEGPTWNRNELMMLLLACNLILKGT